MATTEELLEQLENNPEMYASEESQELVIDAETRTINIPASETLFGVKGDKNIERKYFRCPRIVGDNIDLSTHLIYIAYVYAESNSGSIFPSIGIQPYHCDDVAVDGDDITFSWKLSDHVFQSAGFIAFKMYAKEKEDSPYTVFNTAPALGTVLYTIGDGVESVASEHPDIINQLLAEMESVQEIATPEAMQSYVENYLTENPPSGMTAKQEQQLNQNTQDVADLKSTLEQKITINRIDGVEGNFPTESTTENNLANEENMNNYIAGFHGTHTYEGTSYSYTIEVSTDKNYILEFNGSLPDLSGNYKWLYEENSGSEIGTKNYRELSSYSDDSKTYLKYTPSENTNKITVNVMIQSLSFDIRDGFGVYERSDFLPEEGTDGNYYIEKMFGLPFKCMNFSNDSGSSMSSMSANTYHEELKTYKGEFNTNDIESYREGTDGDYWEYTGEDFITIDCHLITTNTYIYLKNKTFECLPIIRTTKYKSDNYYDICIIGGGAGGIAAAYALKDSGYKVCLVEKNNELGGTHLCSGINSLLSSPINGDWFKNICKDGYEKEKVKITGDRSYGEGDEFEKKYNGSLKTFGSEAADWGNAIVINEAWGRKKYYDDLSEAITVYFNSKFMSSIENNGTIYAVKIKNVVTEEEALIYANYFIDSSGDAVLCRYGRKEGVDYFIGSDKKSVYNEAAYNESYESSKYEINNYELCYYVTANYQSQYGTQTRTEDATERKKYSDISDDSACNAITDTNVFYSQISPGRYEAAPKNIFVDLGSEAVFQDLRQRALDHWEKYKVKAYRRQYLDTYYPMLAIRESYRVKCDKMLTQNDVEHLVINSEIESNHIIALASWWCDSHSINSGINMGSVNNAFLNGIPYETIIPSSFKNVLIASRSFGCSHVASAAYRLTKTVMSLGYVAGLAIKMCRDNWLDDVRDVDITDLQNNCGIKELFELVDSIS